MFSLAIVTSCRRIFAQTCGSNSGKSIHWLKTLSSKANHQNHAVITFIVESQCTIKMPKAHKATKSGQGKTGSSATDEKLGSSKHGVKSERSTNGIGHVSLSPTRKDVKPKQHRKKKKSKKSQESGVAAITQSMGKVQINSKNTKNSKSREIPHRAYSSRSAGSDSNKPTSSNALEEMSKYILSGRAKNIVVMAGAGISTASGIPDFRTPGTGLYDNLRRYNIPFPTAVFDLDYFHKNPRPFFELAKELYPSGKYRPNKAHYFVRMLHEKGLLLRFYTQNIDGLERLAGIPANKLVEAHGTFTTASCTMCGKKSDGQLIKNKIFSSSIPRCQLTPLCSGVIKPDIVFFGEDLPKRFYYYLRDFPVCDLLIVMGTSLEVEPFASLVDSVRYNVPRLLLNRDLVAPFKKNTRSRPRDCAITGELSDTVERLVHKLDWKDDFQRIMESTENSPSESENPETPSCEEESSPSETPTDSGVSSASSVSSDSFRSKPLPPPVDNIKRFFHAVRPAPFPSRPTASQHDSKQDSGEPSVIPSNLSYYDFIRNAAKPPPTSLKPTHKSSPQRPRPATNDKKELVAVYSLAKNSTNAAPPIQYAQTFVKPRSRKFSAKSLPPLRRPPTDSTCSQTDSSDDETSETSGDS